MAYLPPPSEDAYALLALASDPAAAKKRLDEISKASSQLKDTIEASREVEIKISKDRYETAKNLQLLEQNRTAFDLEVKTQKDSIAKSLEDIATQRSRVNGLTAQAESRLKDLDRIEVALNNRDSKTSDREAKLAEWETGLSKRETDLQAKEDDYNQRMSKLRFALD